MKSEFGFRRIAGFICFALFVITSVVSCLPLPLSKPAHSKIDGELTGYWRKEQKNPDEVTVLLIAPFDNNAYLIHAVGYDKKNPSQKDHMVLKGWLTELKGQRFLVMEPDDQLAGPAGITVDRIYPTYRLDGRGGDLVIARLLREGFKPFKNLKTATELAKIIADNLDNPEMYLDAEHWRRLNAKQDKALIEEVMK